MLNLVVNGEVAAQGRYIPELYYNSDMAYPEKLLKTLCMKYLFNCKTPYKLEYKGDIIYVFESNDEILNEQEFIYRTGLTPAVRCEHGMVQWNCTLKSGKTLYAPTLERLFGLWLKA